MYTCRYDTWDVELLPFSFCELCFKYNPHTLNQTYYNIGILYLCSQGTTQCLALFLHYQWNHQHNWGNGRRLRKTISIFLCWCSHIKWEITKKNWWRMITWCVQHKPTIHHHSGSLAFAFCHFYICMHWYLGTYYSFW